MAPAPVAVPARRRRRLWRALAVASAVGVLVVAVAGVLAVRWWSGLRVSTVGRLSFESELAIPPLEEGRREGGRTVYEITAQEGTTTFEDGLATPTAGYDGTFLGPTLRMRRGDEVEVRVTNRLDEPTTTHWHGMELPAVADGGPHSPIAPGETWAPRWTVDQPAATLWYHPHPHGTTEEQVDRGLAGMVLVEEDTPAARALPHRYGVDDVPVILMDRAFADDGSFRRREPTLSFSGALGDELLVNGTHDPHLDVTTERVRLRLLNASPARVYDLAFDDDRPFDLVATDGGLLPAPVTVDSLPLSPGERAEVVVEVEPGERTVLRSVGPDLHLNPLQQRTEGGDDTFDVLQLRAADELEPSEEVPDRLADPPSVDPDDAVRTRRFQLEGTGRIDSEAMDLERIDTVVGAGSVEVWQVQGGGTAHNFHVHGVQMQVLSVDGEDPPARLRGWKDTVYVGGSEVRLLIRFGRHVDPRTPYMYHCHLLRHEDQGMMAQYTVTDDGEGPTRVPPPPGDHQGHGG